jgi:hypothetical protein
MARIMQKTGLRKLIAVASASGIIAAAANISVTPDQPQRTRIVWVGQSGR